MSYYDNFLSIHERHDLSDFIGIVGVVANTIGMTTLMRIITNTKRNSRNISLLHTRHDTI